MTLKLSGLPSDVASIPEPKSVGYAFDDGPSCTHNIFYKYLSSQSQKATMFYIGSSVLDWPLEAQRAIVDGHEICARECFSLFGNLFQLL
jgi:peptidoglycan/xylan/chitin deacetylase (PgdA/CDA1 family)